MSGWDSVLIGGALLQVVGYGITILGVGEMVGFVGPENVVSRIAQAVHRYRSAVSAWGRRVWPVLRHFTTPWGWRPRRGANRTVRASAHLIGGSTLIAKPNFPTGAVSVTDDLAGRVARIESRVAELSDRQDSHEASTNERFDTVERDHRSLAAEVVHLESRIKGVLDSNIETVLTGSLFFIVGLGLTTMAGVAG